MKQFIAVIILSLSISTYAQTSLKSQSGTAASLDQYLWSYSKNSPKPGEKSLIDFDVMDNWRQLGHYLSVSNDGKYFAYTINKPNPAFRYSMMFLNKTDSLVVQSTQHSWRQAFAGPSGGSFTADGKQFVFQNGGSLCFLQLGGTQLKKIENLASYKVSQNKWLAYQLKGKDSLMLRNLATGKETAFAGITGYDFNNERLVCQGSNKQLLLFNPGAGTEKRFSSVDAYVIAENGKALLVKSVDKTGITLQYVTLPGGEAKTIWTGSENTSISNFQFDGSGKQVIANIVDSANATNSGIGYYVPGMEKMLLKFTDQMPGIPAGLVIGAIFANNVHFLQLVLQSKPVAAEKLNKDIAGLEVWNHKDLYLQSAQSGLNGTARFNAIVNIETGRLVFLESNDKKLVQVQGDFALVKKDNSKDFGDRFWEAANEDSLWIVSIKDGNSKLLNTKPGSCWFSPFGNYLVYFDAGKGCHYFSYDLNTGVVVEISANVPENQLGIMDHANDQSLRSGSLAGWIENEASLLVYDNYDIWKLDLTGKQPAINITNGIGLSKRIMLKLFATNVYSNEILTVNASESLLLRGYNNITKQSGYYRKDGFKAGAPAELYMGNYFVNQFSGCHDPNLSNTGMPPMKAQNANSWIVQRQSTNDAPNYYETNDFKNYKRLTNFQPQSKYQWLKEELVSFKHLDGQEGQGILYKPENFDPNKKYPVLIVFYGDFSNNLYQFHVPTTNYDAIIPGQSPIWFLNNGYLVFTPDIVVKPLKNGPKAYSVIEGAAQYLRQLPYVDGNKLGMV